MFEWLLSDCSSRDPNTSDQNSRIGSWLGKQAAILMFFHSLISVRRQQEGIRSVFFFLKSKCQLCHGNVQHSICQDVDNYGFSKLFFPESHFTLCTQYFCHLNHCLATCHPVSLIYPIKGPVRVAVVKMSSASAVCCMQTSNNS